ncbi:hypothetical protein PIB30_060157 [Stylosanthes scabra]|uniref:Disease resistance protein At4g27190-like leucine-rich repeats domain-containing protein n=1 Tax=Stylosanthes scabra TaxID=79078 RepID=A0ABU6VM74_9FABA|nr:hypothetical protein [Stylosanthes scabra]
MSQLECLNIDSKGVQWLVSNKSKYHLNSLTHLHLDLWLIPDESLYYFLHTIPNLQVLNVSPFIREFMPSGNTAPKQRLGTVLLLREFTLDHSDMEDIGFERDPALQISLRHLVLNVCYNLSRLACSSVSFTHLTYLEVTHCFLFKTLLTCSTAKSLVQLTTLKVRYCSRLNEIVTYDQGNDKEIKIVLAKLITIEFEALDNLTSFCSSGNCEFSVPLLEKLTLSNCPNMKTFTPKHIIAPKLRSVLAKKLYYEEEKEYWKGDLNAVVKMVFAAYKVHLKLSNHPELKEVWCDKTLVQVNTFHNVKSLVVKNCGYLGHVIPSHLLHCFKNLEDLEVSNCKAVQVIFNMDDNSNKVRKAMPVSHLKKLSLKNLPNLECVWNRDPKGIIHLQAIQDLSIERCDSLEYVFPSSIAKDLVKLDNLSIENCEQLVTIFAEEKTTSESENTTIMIVFCSLTSLNLRGVPLLKYFYPGLHKLQLPKLRRLHVQADKWMILNCQEAAFTDQQVLVPLEQVLDIMTLFIILLKSV